MLAAEDSVKRKAAVAVKIETDKDLTVDTDVLSVREDAAAILEVEVKTAEGGIRLKDYASAGKDKRKEIAVWLLTK